MSIKIHPNDLPVLAKIFNPNTRYIFIEQNDQRPLKITDPLNCEIIFFKEATQLTALLNKYDLKSAALVQFSRSFISSRNLTILQIEENNSMSTQQKFISYDFINNPDGTIRWVYPSTQKRPTFLHLYNASGWKGLAIKKGIQFGFINGFGKWIKHGSLRVYAPFAPIGTTTKNVSNLFYASDFAIFTGTKGENRKAVIVFENNKKPTHFLKVPLTEVAETLVEREGEQLEQLSNRYFQTLVIPQAIRVQQYLLQTNIRPTTTLSNLKLTSIHLHGLNELYRGTIEKKSLTDTAVWQDIEKELATLKNPQITNDLSPSTIFLLAKQLQVLKTQLATTPPVQTAIAHGDFTPWNTYLTSKQIMVYDWELANRLPLLYDAFHYIFQSGILVKRSSFSEIQKQLEKLRQQSVVKFWLDHYDCSFDIAYRFYLLRTISYYLSRYIRQTYLHEQAYWLVEVWQEALEDKVEVVGSY